MQFKVVVMVTRHLYIILHRSSKVQLFLPQRFWWKLPSPMFGFGVFVCNIWNVYFLFDLTVYAQDFKFYRPSVMRCLSVASPLHFTKIFYLATRCYRWYKECKDCYECGIFWCFVCATKYYTLRFQVFESWCETWVQTKSNENYNFERLRVVIYYMLYVVQILQNNNSYIVANIITQ